MLIKASGRIEARVICARGNIKIRERSDTAIHRIQWAVLCALCARMHKEQADENRRRQRRRNVDFRFTGLFYVALWSRDFTERKKRTAARILDGRF